jgi:hypothetical protein
VPAMQRTGTIAFRRDNGYQMVRLPYKGDRTAMYVILPDSGGVGPLLSRFARQGWPASLTARDNRRVHLVLPRLHVEHTLDLQPVLNGIGAGIAFDCDRADFRDLATDNHGKAMAKLCIGKASQAFIWTWTRKEPRRLPLRDWAWSPRPLSSCQSSSSSTGRSSWYYATILPAPTCLPVASFIRSLWWQLPADSLTARSFPSFPPAL